jgi:hypothetical protein
MRIKGATMNSDDPELEKEKERYEQGDKAQLLYWLNYCITNHKPMPAWLEEAFQKAYHAGQIYEIKSWDEVFGKPPKKGARQAIECRNMKISEPLFYRVRDRYVAGEPMDEGLFDRVGAEFGISGTVAKDLYYELMHEMIENE